MTAPARLPAADRPVVTGDDAFADQRFTADHPGRRYHRRAGPDGSVWLIRRQGRAYLLTLARPAIDCPDTDDALRVAWFEAAWPDLDRPARDALITAARTAERAMKATAGSRPPGRAAPWAIRGSLR